MLSLKNKIDFCIDIINNIINNIKIGSTTIYTLDCGMYCRVNSKGNHFYDVAFENSLNSEPFLTVRFNNKNDSSISRASSVYTQNYTMLGVRGVSYYTIFYKIGLTDTINIISNLYERIPITIKGDEYFQQSLIRKLPNYNEFSLYNKLLTLCSNNAIHITFYEQLLNEI